MRNRCTATDVPFVEPALRTHSLALESPWIGEGACDTLSALGHDPLSDISRSRGSGGQRAKKTTQAPLHSPPGRPWTRFSRGRLAAQAVAKFLNNCRPTC